MVSILGISAFYHDSAAAILVDGKIIAAAQEERFSRLKHDSSFPKSSIKFVLKKANINLTNWDIVGINPNDKNWTSRDIFCFWANNINFISIAK